MRRYKSRYTDVVPETIFHREQFLNPHFLWEMTTGTVVTEGRGASFALCYLLPCRGFPPLKIAAVEAEDAQERKRSKGMVIKYKHPSL